MLARPSKDSAASKELVVDHYKVQWAILSKTTQTKKGDQKANKTKANTQKETPKKGQRQDCNQQLEFHAR